MDGIKRKIIKNFVVFEGLDGSGTTTQLRNLDSWLGSKAIPHWTTFEPTGLATGDLVRRILRHEVTTTPETLARLYAADRNEHLFGAGGVMDHLAAGDLVVSDRYIFSSLAYQTVACGPELPSALNAAFPLPELLLFFDLPADLSLGRVDGRGERELFDTLGFQRQVREAYEACLRSFQDQGMTILKIDASQSIPEVEAQVRGALAPLLQRSGGTLV